MDQAVVEDTAGHCQVLYSGQGRITRDRFNGVDVPDLPVANSVSHIRVARIESPVERAKQWLADLLRYFVAFRGVRDVLRYGLLAEDRLFRFQGFNDDLLVRVRRRRHDDRIDPL